VSTVVEELVALFGFDVDERTLRQANRAIDRTERNMRGATQEADRLGRGLQGMFLAWVGLDQFLQGMRGLTNVNAEFEDLSVAMGTTIQVAQDAGNAIGLTVDDAMGWVRSFAASSPDQLGQVTRAFQGLLAQGLDPMDGRMTALGNTAAALQMPIDELINAMSGAAIGNLERLESQTTRFGISLRSQNGILFALRNGVEEEIGGGFRSIEAFLNDLGGGQFAGAMDRRAETLNGLFSMLGDAVSQFALKVGEEGFSGGLREATGALTEMVRGGGDAAVIIGRVLGGALTRAAAGLVWFDQNAALVATFLAWLGGTAAVAGIIAVTNAIAAMGTTALIAQAKMFAIPAALAAIGVLVALVADDFNRWLNDPEADTLIGRLIARNEELGDRLERLRNLLADIDEHGSTALGLFRADLEAVLDSLGRIGPALREIPLLGALLGDEVTVGGIMAGINPAANFMQSRELDGSELFSGGPNMLGRFGEAAAELLMGGAGLARGDRLDRGVGLTSVAERDVETFAVGDININITPLPGERIEDTAARAAPAFIDELRRSRRWLP